ncbi:MAG: hypothetical protein GY862_33295 [Gammaproteobacteria bacterium]|nr:hypothetical protein [Gammaproteobacteria bacterium]
MAGSTYDLTAPKPIMAGGMMGFGAVKFGGSPEHTGAPLPILRPRLRLLQWRNHIGYSLPLDNISVHKAADIQKYLEQILLYCDAVILLYEKISVAWANEQVLYCRRMRGLRERPFKVFALCDKLEELFRHYQQGEINETEAFVNLLLGSSRHFIAQMEQRRCGN